MAAFGRIAQLVRAPRLHRGGQGFESFSLIHRLYRFVLPAAQTRFLFHSPEELEESRGKTDRGKLSDNRRRLPGVERLAGARGAAICGRGPRPPGRGRRGVRRWPPRGRLGGRRAPSTAALIADAPSRARTVRGTLFPVINATGVIVHTNSRRAPSVACCARGVDHAGQGYVNLEYDLDAGSRGSLRARGGAPARSGRAAEAALVVNNNAGAGLPGPLRWRGPRGGHLARPAGRDLAADSGFPTCCARADACWWRWAPPTAPIPAISAGHRPGDCALLRRTPPTSRRSGHGRSPGGTGQPGAWGGRAGCGRPGERHADRHLAMALRRSRWCSRASHAGATRDLQRRQAPWADPRRG